MMADKDLFNLVKMMRDAQAKHRKTLVYGYRNTSIRLEKEVDSRIAEIEKERNRSKRLLNEMQFESRGI